MRKAFSTLALALLCCSFLSAPIHVGATEQTNQTESRNLRERIKAGALRPCVTESVSDRDSQPVITLENHCARQANVMLCVSVSGRPAAQYLLLIDARSKARHRIWIDTGVPFQYNYNSCDRPYCTPPRSEC
jgi:hypothetical protein